MENSNSGDLDGVYLVLVILSPLTRRVKVVYVIV